MKKQFIKKMEKKLVSEREAIVAKASLDENSANIDFDGDEVDEIQGNLLLYLNEKINSRYGKSIRDIDAALLKIKNNEYGVCEDCDEEISEKRLEFNPYFTTCIKCAEIREKESKQTR